MEREVLEVNANNERLQRTHAELGELQVSIRGEKDGGPAVLGLRNAAGKGGLV
jgi:hypothetical protein